MAPRLRHLIRYGTIAAALTACALGLHTWTAWSPAAPPLVLAADAPPSAVTLRTPAQHDDVRAAHGEPYVLALESGGGALCYFGGWHSRERSDPQLADIRARWEAFRPTVALCEGRSRGYFLGPLIPRFAGYPEPALVHALARQDGVPLHSLEPSYADEVDALLREGFAPRLVALYFTLRVYASERAGRRDEALALELAAKRCDVVGLRGALRTAADLDDAWRESGGEGDWRELAGEESAPSLADIGDASRRLRGEHMVRALVALVRRGERVFAVVGSGHVIRQEPALREALR